MSERSQFQLQEQHVPTDHHAEFSRRSLLGQAVLASACGIVGFLKHLTAKASTFVPQSKRREVISPKPFGTMSETRPLCWQKPLP